MLLWVDNIFSLQAPLAQKNSTVIARFLSSFIHLTCSWYSPSESISSLIIFACDDGIEKDDDCMQSSSGCPRRNSDKLNVSWNIDAGSQTWSKDTADISPRLGWNKFVLYCLALNFWHFSNVRCFPKVFSFWREESRRLFYNSCRSAMDQSNSEIHWRRNDVNERWMPRISQCFGVLMVSISILLWREFG